MRKDPLQLVKMLADISELEKSQYVATSMMQLSAEKQRLALLEQYLEEYCQGAAPDTVVDIGKLTSSRGFIDALTKAVVEQSDQVARLSQQFEQRLDTWRAAKAKSTAVDNFASRKQQTRMLEESRREQSSLDEAGRWNQCSR